MSSCKGRVGLAITGKLERVVDEEVFLVDCTFCWYWQRCPFAVATLLGKCFRTRADVRPGHVVKKPLVIALVHDDTTGLKADNMQYLHRAAFSPVVSSWTTTITTSFFTTWPGL